MVKIIDIEALPVRAVKWGGQWEKVVSLDVLERMPEKRGLWIFKKDDITLWNQCSECGYEDEDCNGYPFCPYCGARMD